MVMSIIDSIDYGKSSELSYIEKNNVIVPIALIY